MNPSEDTEGRGRQVAAATGAASVQAVAVAATSAADKASRPDVPKTLADLLEKLPANDYAPAQQIMEKLLEGGPSTIATLVELVGPEFGDEDGVKPKYAVHGLVHYASRPGADAQRKLVARTLAEQLGKNHSDELKAFICRQLQLCGRDGEVPALSKLLSSDRLCEPATQALCAIGTPAAVTALRGGLTGASGNRRTTLVNAVGRFGDKAAADEVRKDIAAKDRDLRLCAWYALGNMGDAAAADGLVKALDTDSSFERSQALDACLRLSRSLSKAGDGAKAEKICRDLLSKFQGGEQVHDRCAALAALADVVGVGAVDDLIEALGSKDVSLRHHSAWTAVDLGASIQGDHATQAEKLLQKVLQATTEEVVLRKANNLLGKDAS